jgi:hypothetical protein
MWHTCIARVVTSQGGWSVHKLHRSLESPGNSLSRSTSPTKGRAHVAVSVRPHPHATPYTPRISTYPSLVHSKHHFALLKTSKNPGMAHFNRDHHLCLPHFGAHPPKKAALNSVLGSSPFENPNAPTLQNTRVLHALYSTGQPLLRVNITQVICFKPWFENI